MEDGLKSVVLVTIQWQYSEDLGLEREVASGSVRTRA